MNAFTKIPHISCEVALNALYEVYTAALRVLIAPDGTVVSDA